MKRIVSVVLASFAALFVVAGTAALVSVLDRELTAGMQALKTETIQALEQLLGRKIGYESISPSVLPRVEIRNLSIYDSMDSERVLLSIRKVRVSYSLFQLLLHRDPAGALREIRIENTTLDIDPSKDGDVSRLLEKLFSSRGNGKEARIRFSGANVNVNLALEGASVSLSNVFFQVDSGRDSFEVSLRGGADGELSSGFDFHSALKIRGRVGKLLDWTDLSIRFASFSSSLLNSTSPQTYQVVWKDKRIEVRKIWDHTPFDLQFLVDQTRNSYTLSFQSEGLRPSRLFRLTGPLERYNSWLDAPMTASADVTYNPTGKSLEYRLDYSAFFERQLPVKDAQVTAHVYGSKKAVYFQPLSLVTPTGEAKFEGDILFENLLPQGKLSVTDLQTVRGERVNGKLIMERGRGTLAARGEKLELGEFLFDSFNLSLLQDIAGERFSLAASFDGNPREHSVRADGVFHFGKKPSLSLSASLVGVPVDKSYNLVMGTREYVTGERDISALFSKIIFSAELALTTDFSDFNFRGRPVVFTRRDDPTTRLEGGFAIDPNSLSISDFSGTWGGYKVSGDFSGSFHPKGRVVFNSSLKYRDTPYSITGNYSPVDGLSMTGDYGLAVSLKSDGEGGRALKARAERFPLPLGGGFQTVSFGLEGLFGPEGDWWVACPSLSLYDLPFLHSVKNATTLSFSAFPGFIGLTRVRYSDDISVLEGRGKVSYQIEEPPADGDFLKGLNAQVSLDFKARDGKETYAINGGVKRGILDTRVEFSSVPLKRAGSFAMAGEFAGNAKISGPVALPTIDLSFSIVNGRLGTDPFSLSAGLTLRGDRLEVNALNLNYLSHKLSQASGVLELRKGTYDFTASYTGEHFGDMVETAARLEGGVKAASWERISSHFLDSGVNGKLTLSHIKVKGKDYPSWEMDAHSEGGVLLFDGGPGNSIHGSFNSENSFALRLGSPLPVVGKAEGKVVGDRIEITLDVDTADMRVLNSLLNTPVITFTSGVATGRLAISGPVNDPDYLGNLQVIGGGITCLYARDEAGPLNTNLVFSGKTFSFPPLHTTAGNSRLNASASFTIDHWVPVSFAINLQTENQTALKLVGRFGTVKVEGLGSGNVSISGDDKSVEVKGFLLVTDGQITAGGPVKETFTPEDTPTFLALELETGKRVEFNWPSAESPIIRTMAKAGDRLSITYRGDTGAYTVKGEAEMHGGEVFYFDRSFILKIGKIFFDETDKDFDPRITVRAEIREWDAKTNEEVKIYLDADAKLSQLSPRFSSDPSRSDLDIMTMVGSPIADRVESQGIGISAVMLGGDFLRQFGVIRPLEQKAREALGVDSFSLRTQLVQNLIAQQLGTTVNPLDNTSLSLGKYLGNDFFWEVLVRLQSQTADPSVVGVTTGVHPDIEINLEWNTPFFLLNWSLIPKTPESLFIPDNSISLNWRFQY